ncbi:MAG: hypothetical protein J2P37_15045 [Ktedonobacteraceae bacterium]|nr:hypothetical protein [Ktedonobacteraceae bacterium]MBO0791574.1 hypothetical protein [Ktedonobacteraceae bacterium]
MNALRIEPQVQWTTASPLWSALPQEPAQRQQRMRSPALLRFASDTFMEDLAQRLQNVLLGMAPDLSDLVARAESFRERPTGAPPGWQPDIQNMPLKLYQPVHGHFYLVAASLVCRIPGMPDRFVDTARGEKASFVLRRIGSNGQEMAWVRDPVQGKGWTTLTPDATGDYKTLAGFEELYPLFPVNFTENNRHRRLLVGLLPTSSRDTFQAAPQLSPILGENDTAVQDERKRLGADPRLEEAKGRVTDMLDAFKTHLVPPLDVLETSRFILLDLAEVLATYLPALWQAIKDNARPAQQALTSLYELLARSTLTDRVSSTQITWLAALQAVRSEFDHSNYDAANLQYDLRQTNLDGDTLYAAFKDALDATPPPAMPPASSTAPADVAVPKLDARPGVKYILRCVYQRPQCGPLHPDVLSNATEAFELASFFDFDAPARPIRISMPVDTSVAGLRKFKKNVAFILSDKLRQQMECVSDAKKALDGSLGCDQEFNIGTICSFSIPIITICAFIVLFIFLILLNIVFWWLPFIRICFPISLKAKG